MTKNISALLVLGFCLSATPAMAQNNPVVAAISFCDVNPKADDGNDHHGAGARADNRSIEIKFAYWKRDANDLVLLEIAFTYTVELCYAKVDPATGNSVMTCPWIG